MFAVDLNYPPVRYTCPKVESAYRVPVRKWLAVNPSQYEVLCNSYNRINYRMWIVWVEPSTQTLFSFPLRGKVYKGKHRTRVYEDLSGFVRINHTRYMKVNVPR